MVIFKCGNRPLPAMDCRSLGFLALRGSRTSSLALTGSFTRASLDTSVFHFHGKTWERACSTSCSGTLLWQA